ncbi:MAG: DNA mismatch repair endonuclease MutL [Desertifilum sp. SIO1I2]|nr:DNA mismatch repair endonuclease MutL [Desertifilum sp. SIO1I2]
MSIQSLPAEVVHLIAAGEVIDSLASVVRELVENSIDAGATRIVIDLWPEHWRVRLADNGCGMSLEDLEKAAMAHSTSKIFRREDLWKITSLGFRGEALHSLAQLADLEIHSRAETADEGNRVVYNALGDVVETETVAIAPGTVVTVSNLFGHWISRRQGLPSPGQQLKAIQNQIYQIALCHPQINWQVNLDNRAWFALSPGRTPQQILPQIIRNLRFGDLHYSTLAVELESEDLQPCTHQIDLTLGLPDRCHRGKADWVKVAVNGRLVQIPELERAVLSAFAKTLPRDRFPVCFLHLQASPQIVDWNRHPAKAEIYLHQGEWWQEQVKNAIAQALCLHPENLASAIHQERVTTLLKVAEEKNTYRVIPSTTSEPILQSSVIDLRAVAQVRNTYILAEHPGGMWLVEQHIAHERILYEQLCDRWQLIPLETPIILHQLKPAQLEQLQRLHIECEPFGEQLWVIRNAPELLHQRPDCADAIVELSLGGDLQTAQVATACRSAIRNGTPLNLSQMQTILDQWQRTRNPRTCPHGRPIYLSLEETALARFFRRHWVIGKSHGI